MKTKNIFTAIIISLIVFALIFGAVYLSTLHRRRGGAEKVICAYPAFNNEVYIGRSSLIDTQLIDTQNVTITEVKFDLTEFGVHTAAMVNIGNVDALNLYFSAKYDSKTRFFAKNLLTGNISEIVFESDFEVLGFNFDQFYVSGGYLYYFAWDRPEDGVFDNVTDSFCRVPLTGGREEVIAEFPHYGERTAFSFVADGMAFFCDVKKISVCNVATGKTEVLWTAKSLGYDIVDSNLSYYDGLIYFTASSAAREELVPEDPDYYANMTTTSSYLFSLDPKTKRSTLITEEPINSFYIADDRIYYIPKALGTITAGDKIMPRFCAKEVYSFDLRGRNKEKVCSFGDIFVSDILYLNDSVICVSDYYGENFSTSYCIINRQTGEVRRVIRVMHES